MSRSRVGDKENCPTVKRIEPVFTQWVDPELRLVVCDLNCRTKILLKRLIFTGLEESEISLRVFVIDERRLV
jgi:hypothetical protein